MVRALFGVFIVLHGLVHLWYVTLSQQLVAFKPEMGWSGRSWLFTTLLGDPTTRTLASVVYVLAAVAFVASGAGMFLRVGWWRPVLTGAAVLSSVAILLFWDGGLEHIVEKGLLGLLINAGLLVALLALNWPPETF